MQNDRKIELTELRTERLLLRPFSPADVDDVFAYASDPEWSRYLPEAPRPYERHHADDFIEASLSSWGAYPQFAIVLNGKVIGDISLAVSRLSEVGCLGYSLAREHWGQGLVPEAARAVIDWGFGTLELGKIFATADARNHRSYRVMEKLGMTREAYLRKHRYSRGEIIDEVWYGILKEEWESARQPGT
jgi:ribosomal-protein-alanine N-acetyltransferase